MTHCCPIVELRQYTLHRDQRDVLIGLFDKEFIEPQEAVGARVIGQFRDLDDPDRFVWLRGFETMEERTRALAAFYDGPVWKAHRQAANATIHDSDNVLLLHPTAAEGGFELTGKRDGRASGVFMASIHYLTPELTAAFVAFFDAHMRPQIEAAGAKVTATFVSETSANTFPRLPIRDDHVHVWFARFDDERAQHAFAERLGGDSGWRDAAPETLLPAFMRKPEILRLSPTPRSLLR